MSSPSGAQAGATPSLHPPFRKLLWIGTVTFLLAAGIFTWFLWTSSNGPGDNQKQRRASQAPEDPRLLYQGPFQNVHPGVHYVGTKTCAGCHDDIAETYARHPMARTLIPIADLAGVQPYDKAHHNPFSALDAVFTVERRGNRVWHRQTGPQGSEKPVYRQEFEVHYAIGSGNHGHSYLADRGGYLFQTPISWFTQKDFWDISPGFQKDRLSGRPVKGECLFCHSNRAQSLDDYLNRYAQPIFPVGHGIGCERCHGPGEKHANGQMQWVPIHPEKEFSRMSMNLRRLLKNKQLAAHDREALEKLAGEEGPEKFMEQLGRLWKDNDFQEPGRALLEDLRGSIDPRNRLDASIVNPAALKRINPELCEAICQQCHLSGEARILRRGRGLYDYRPGLPLDAAWSIFVFARKPEEKWKAVNHVEQMYLSKCFQGTSGENKLGCISCHDPHRHIGPDERVAFFRQRCLKCHAEGEARKDRMAGCAVPLMQRQEAGEKNSCIDCHMKRYMASDIVHNASTDHRILRKADKGKIGKDSPSLAPLVPFHKARVDLKDKELSRDLGLALATMFGSWYADQAVPLLEAALENDPDDIDAWEKKAFALMQLRRPGEALAALETVVNKAPGREMALSQGAALAQSLGQEETALKFLRRAKELNPWLVDYPRNLALLLAHLGATTKDANRATGYWEQASQECRKWLELDPSSVAARKLWIDCLLHQGNVQEAHGEFARLEALRPDNLEQLKAWFKLKIDKVTR